MICSCSLSRLSATFVSSAVQFNYLLSLCIWLFSFLPDALPLFSSEKYNLVGWLVQSLNTSSSEKVIRVNVCIVQNMMHLPSLCEELISCGAIRRLNLLDQRIFKDADISETLRVVLDYLKSNYELLSSFDLYVKEVQRGVLRAGPRHTDDFWKENVRKFETDDFALIKRLIALLDSEDKETVCIACADLGAFAIFYPNGRK